MRVTFLTAGIPSDVVRLAAELKKRGYSPCIISIDPPGALAAHVYDAGIPLYSAGARGAVVPDHGKGGRSRVRPFLFPGPRVVAGLIARLREVHTQVLVTAHFPATLLGRIVAPLAGVRCLVSWLGDDDSSSLLRNLALLVTDSASRLTVVSTPKVAEAVAARGVVSRRRLRVIPNAVATDGASSNEASSNEASSNNASPNTPARADANIRRKLRIGEKEFVWLAVGELAANDDYATLIDACARLCDLTEEWRLLIVGEGALRRDLESRRDRFGLNERVQLLGFRSDSAQLLRAADAFVISATRAGAPTSLIEAMLARRPCVATQVGGIPDLVENGVTGWLVPPRRPDRLADRMYSVMQLPAAQRAAIGAAAGEFAASAFDVHRVMDDWEDVLTEAVRRRLPGAVAPSILTPGSIRPR